MAQYRLASLHHVHIRAQAEVVGALPHEVWRALSACNMYPCICDVSNYKMYIKASHMHFESWFARIT